MKESTFQLKDGREVTLRLLKSEDKDALQGMMADLSREALRWSSPPYDEVKISRWMSGAESGLSIVAVFEGRMVGISAIYQFVRPREIGIGSMMIYIHQDFHGVGLGTAMTDEILMLAKDRGLHRIGLEVVEDNAAAVALYKREGFKVEGILRDAYFGEGGRYHNMLVMGIILSEN